MHEDNRFITVKDKTLKQFGGKGNHVENNDRWATSHVMLSASFWSDSNVNRQDYRETKL